MASSCSFVRFARYSFSNLKGTDIKQVLFLLRLLPLHLLRVERDLVCDGKEKLVVVFKAFADVSLEVLKLEFP